MNLRNTFSYIFLAFLFLNIKILAQTDDEVKEEGSHFVVFDASDLPSGVYVYSIRVNDFNYNQKMLFMK